MSVTIFDITPAERDKLLAGEEGHFSDFKSIAIAPAKLTRTIAALSNAEGGEVYVGIAQDAARNNSWAGFDTVEKANGHIQAFETLFPLGDGYGYSFLRSKGDDGLVLKIDVSKNRDVKRASDGRVYVRRGAQNIPYEADEALERLRRNKGLTSFETEAINIEESIITNSTVILEFLLEIVPTAEPEPWLRNSRRPGWQTHRGRCSSFRGRAAGGIAKTFRPENIRYATNAEEGTRDTLVFDPRSIEGHAYKQIHDAVQQTAEIIEAVRINTPEGLQSAKYPITALHEIITNAVLHRDYSIADDIHIRIFDNRVEVTSPGTLPAHITPANILDERFARNPTIVRLINKFPNPPNKDVGEGLNTAFSAMRAMKLKPPVIEQKGGNVMVVLKHEPLASPEEIILEYLQDHDRITNRIARELSFIGSENKMKGILQRLVKNGHIELVPGTTRYSAAYRLSTTKAKR